MRIYLTLPYDPNGVEEVETVTDPVGDIWTTRSRGGTQTNGGFYKEGVTWHRTKTDALEAARLFRANWISETAAKAAHVAALPAI